MKNKEIYKYIQISILLSLPISVLVQFTELFEMFISLRFENGSFFAFTFHGLIELAITFFACMCLFSINFYIIKPFNAEYKVKITDYIIALIISFIVVSLVTHYLFAIRNSLFDMEPSRDQLFLIFKDLFLATVVLICTLVIKIFNQRNHSKLEVQKLKFELLNHQFDMLKNQLSPHFLFNTLSSLKTLINESPPVAQTYLDHLSAVLRYSLSATEKNLVTLRQELEFVQSYINLIQLRFSENISFQMDVEKRYHEYSIPPLAIQTLIENAIKHNEISSRHPLRIGIESTNNNSLIVKNNINNKYNPEPGLGLGLTNLDNQFRIISGKEIIISKINGFFKVEIPLLEL
jgi:sensor histidine kinase YesM